MFLLDSLMISGIKWALKTVVTAAEAEMNDDAALRDRLLEAEMQREMGEISDEEFATIEADLLKAIREIRERREGGSGPLAFGGAQPLEAGENSRYEIEAELSGDFYGPPDTHSVDAAASTGTAPPPREPRTIRTIRTTRTTRTIRTTRTTRTPKRK